MPQPELEPHDVLNTMDRALQYVSKLQKSADEEVLINFNNEFLAVGASHGNEFKYILKTLKDRNLLDIRGDMSGSRSSQFFRLTPEGWERVGQLRRLQPDSNQAFVAMWFDKEMESAWTEGFKPALDVTGFSPLRIDLLEHNESIDDKIIAEIRRSALMVADFTGGRPGVYFEAGFAKGLEIPVIWTCRKDHFSQLHFDTDHFNHIVWVDPMDLHDRLKSRIEATASRRTAL